jgi:hypothetical protein
LGAKKEKETNNIGLPFEEAGSVMGLQSPHMLKALIIHWTARLAILLPPPQRIITPCTKPTCS